MHGDVYRFQLHLYCVTGLEGVKFELNETVKIN